MNQKQLVGSQTAKNGFKNEDDIVIKFQNWQNDNEARAWLTLMKYNLEEIEFVHAEKLSGYKTDVQIQVTIKLKKVIDVENLQVKLVSNKRGFNQIDKRWIDKYVEMWEMPKPIISILKRYTGEEKPSIANPKDKRRMHANEFSDEEQIVLKNWFRENKSLVISDILKGRGKFAAEWILVAQKIQQNARWVLKPMNICMNHYGNGDIEITAKGNIKIGRLTMQRKGGDNGRDTAKMLQFKIDPMELFDI